MESPTCGQISVIVIGLALLYFLFKSFFTSESYANFTSFHHNLPNKNSFRNAYRIGYHESQKLGWKPTDTWDHLRPEYNEAPDCFWKDPIYTV